MNAKFLLFTLVLTRVSGLIDDGADLRNQDVPMQVRGLLAVALALLITPTQWHVRGRVSRHALNYLVFLGGEALIGVCLGLGIVILFSGMSLAGADDRAIGAG